MAARPKGTDGRDFKYRETIESTYQLAAHARMVITRCLMVHFGMAAVRTVWASLVNAAAGRALSFELVAIAALELLAAALWRAARPGHARESLPVLKAFNITQALLAVLQFLYIFEYYVADLRKLPDLGAVAARRLAEEGLILADPSDPASLAPLVESLRGFTLFLDMTLLLFVLFGARTAHMMIIDKMQAQKARELKRAGAVGVGGAAPGTFKPESTTGLAALARRAPAAAVADRDEGAAAAVKAAQATDRTRARRRHA